jgi:hypothetical protein
MKGRVELPLTAADTELVPAVAFSAGPANEFVSCRADLADYVGCDADGGAKPRPRKRASSVGAYGCNWSSHTRIKLNMLTVSAGVPTRMIFRWARSGS